MRAPFAVLSAAIAALPVLFSGCASSDTQAQAMGASVAPADVPSWCGPKKIELGLLDGYGGNSWRLVATASGKEEAAKCPSVTNFRYADGQGNTLEGDLRHQGHGVSRCGCHGGLPRRRQGGAARADGGLQGGRGHRALPRRPGRQGRRQLRQVDR